MFCPVPAVVFLEPSSPHFRLRPFSPTPLQILVLMLRESQREAVATAIQFEVQNERLDNALIMFFFVPKMGGEDEEVNGGDLPSKALLNAVGDLCQTRYPDIDVSRLVQSYSTRVRACVRMRVSPICSDACLYTFGHVVDAAAEVTRESLFLRTYPLPCFSGASSKSRRDVHVFIPSSALLFTFTHAKCPLPRDMIYPKTTGFGVGMGLRGYQLDPSGPPIATSRDAW